MKSTMKYTLSGKCPNTNTTCKFYGYQNPYNCEKCICPDGRGGTYCEGLGSSDQGIVKYNSH